MANTYHCIDYPYYHPQSKKRKGGEPIRKRKKIIFGFDSCGNNRFDRKYWINDISVII
jgi:hypothetical protein